MTYKTKNRAVAITLLICVSSLGFLSSCNSQTNILFLLTPPSQQESFDYLLDAGQAAYDAGDQEEALVFAEKAYNLNPYSEEAAVLFGFVSLALAGIDTFGLVSALQTDEETEESEEAALLEEEEKASTGTSDTLSKFKKIVGVTPEEFKLLATEDTSDPDLPVLIPKCAEEVRPLVRKLELLDKAIKAICIFVDTSVIVKNDPRQNCEILSGSRRLTGKTHFLWAFTHLTEALAFHSVLTYSSTSGSKTNLELRAEKVKSMDMSDPANLSTLVSSFETLKNTVNAVMPSGDCSSDYPTSQLAATLFDMLATDNAFKAIPGTPESVTNSISKAMEKIQDIQQNSTNSSDSTGAMKGDMTKKLSSALSSKIDGLETESGTPVSAQKAAELCSSYDSISSGESKPVLCGGSG